MKAKRFLQFSIITILLLGSLFPRSVIAASLSATPPINDDILNAKVVNALLYIDTIDTTLATNSPDDPTTCPSYGTVWYRFTPASDTLISANTFGSDYDTVLGVFIGYPGPGGLIPTPVACNDDTYENLQSQVSFMANADTTYYFMIGECCVDTVYRGGTLVFSVTLNQEVSIPVLDNFDRLDGSLGADWLGYKNAYRILNNQVDVRRDGTIYWEDAFGVNQQAAITLATVDTEGFEQDLLLKVQGEYGPNWGEGVIEVLYSAQEGTATVCTFRPDTLDWFGYPSIPVVFADGDQFGAQALVSGDVVILQNGIEIGRVTLNAADQAFFNPKGGHIGLWFINAKNAFLDDFSGGDVDLP